MLTAAAIVVLGLHLPTLLNALSDHPTNVGYLSSPTAFWLVKFMDLGIVVPIAVTVGVGLVKRCSWARRPLQAVLGGYAFLATSVSAMAVVMYAKHDADASLTQAAVASSVALILLGLFAAQDRAMFRRHDNHPRLTTLA